MMYAIDKDGKKSQAQPMAKGICPECMGAVIARCGSINIWHWAHTTLTDCDMANKQETEWHLRWKSFFDKKYVEVRLDNGKIADALLINNISIEFQNSRIGSDKIKEYESTRKNLIWVFNGSTFCDNLYVYKKDNYHKFHWKWAPKTIRSCDRPVFLDINGDSSTLFLIKKNYGKYGWGYQMDRNYFFKKYLFVESEFMDLKVKDWILSEKEHERYNRSVFGF